MLEQICFGLVALAILFSALRVVSTTNLVHTVLWLGVTLASTAVLFVMLEAPFMAAMQLMLYTGGLLTLMLFGVMLTQRDQGLLTTPNASHRRVLGSILSIAVFLMVGQAILATETLPDAPAAPISTQALGALFFTEHALAFEVLAVLLLAVTLGAIVIARKSDAGQEVDLTTKGVAERRRLPLPKQPLGEGKGA